MTSPFPGERDEERAKRQIPVAQVLGKWWRVVTVAVLFASAQLGLGGTRLVVASPGPDGPRAPAARAASAQGAARDYSRLYSSATLESVRAYYERTSGKIRDQLIAPALFAAEKQSLSGTQYAFPVYLSPVSPAQPHPTNFVAFGNTVVLPLFSLKFLEDLCVAYAWLQIHGFGVETVSEYTAILKYGAEPARGFPPPLVALQIPTDARSEDAVDRLARNHFVTAQMFLQLHELAHLYYRHGQSLVANEAQADQFAAAIMQRAGLPPKGVLIWLLADAHWSSFPVAGDHPLTGSRVLALAEKLDDPALAAEVRRFGGFLDDPEIRVGFAASGKASDLSSLAPRVPGELPRTARRAATAGHRAPFDGNYAAAMVQLGDAHGPVPAQFNLRRSRDDVKGSYTFGIGTASLEGTVSGDVLNFEWVWASNYGRGVLTVSPDGRFSGTWGYREARSGAGTWSGAPIP